MQVGSNTQVNNSVCEGRKAVQAEKGYKLQRIRCRSSRKRKEKREKREEKENNNRIRTGEVLQQGDPHDNTMYVHPSEKGGELTINNNTIPRLSHISSIQLVSNPLSPYILYANY